MSATRTGGWRAWVPALILAAGIAVGLRGKEQHEPELRLGLGQAVPAALASHRGEDVTISEEEQRVAGMTSYLYRTYSPVAEGALPFTLYVGYYASQAYGRTIHSPKNCLPGAGWEALSSQTVSLGAGAAMVNYYLLQNGDDQALAIYWYQGRGRVESNEYRVKWDLVRDAALRGRTEEALVRVVVPITREDEARAVAIRVAREVIPAVNRALPT